MSPQASADLHGEIAKAIRGNNFQRADIAIRSLLQREPESAEAHLLLAELAARLERWHVHANALKSATSLGAVPPAKSHDQQFQRSQTGHLLVCEWGHGFWSDVAHVLGSMLLAEIREEHPLSIGATPPCFPRVTTKTPGIYTSNRSGRIFNYCLLRRSFSHRRGVMRL